MNVLELSEQEIIRRNSLNELRAMGIEPYPAAEYVTNAFSTDIKAEFKDDEEPRKVSVVQVQRETEIVISGRFCTDWDADYMNSILIHIVRVQVLLSVP